MRFCPKNTTQPKPTKRTLHSPLTCKTQEFYVFEFNVQLSLVFIFLKIRSTLSRLISQIQEPITAKVYVQNLTKFLHVFILTGRMKISWAATQRETEGCQVQRRCPEKPLIVKNTLSPLSPYISDQMLLNWSVLKSSWVIENRGLWAGLSRISWSTLWFAWWATPKWQVDSVPNDWRILRYKCTWYWKQMLG